MSCPPGKELYEGLCYDPCRTGYEREGGSCVAVCPEGFPETESYCLKEFDRTEVQAVCSPNFDTTENGLCRMKCEPGYVAEDTNVRRICRASCPPGLPVIDSQTCGNPTGAPCPPPLYQSGVNSCGRTIYTENDTEPLFCPEGSEQYLDVGVRGCYTTCPVGWITDGLVCRASVCPANTTDRGDRCEKDRTPSGQGVSPTTATPWWLWLMVAIVAAIAVITVTVYLVLRRPTPRVVAVA